MRISIIVAMAQNRVIGKDNKLPWYLPADLRHFKNITMGHPIIMGRKTHESIGKALPGRRNIVVTRRPDYRAAKGCVTAHSLQQAITLSAGAEEVFVIGGASLYREALPFAQRIYLTEVHAEVPGDTYFPAIDMAAWKEISRERFPADKKNVYSYSFVVLEKLAA